MLKKILPMHTFTCLIFMFLLGVGGLSGCAPKKITGFTAHPSAPASLGLKVVHTATTQIGKPYRSGGTSPQKGFDCSGLIYWAFHQNGVIVPRVTIAQARTGQPVSRAKLMPGDIVVFRAPSAPNGLHTAVYMGQGNFVHSPNSKSRVRVDSLNTPHWNHNYLTARRIATIQAGR